MCASPVEVLDISDPSTASLVWKIQVDAYEVEAEMIGFPGIPPLRETLEQMVAKPLQWLGIRDDTDGEVVAAIGFNDRGGVIDVDRLFVAPGCLRNGHAGDLLETLGMSRKITVRAAHTNEPAVRLYESQGFVRQSKEEVAPGLIIVHFTREPA